MNFDEFIQKECPALLCHDMTSELVKVGPPPEWQRLFCHEHGRVNGWAGHCSKVSGECLIDKLLDSDFDLEKLSNVEIAHGISIGQVLGLWSKSEPMSKIQYNPMWLLCMAEHIYRERTE